MKLYEQGLEKYPLQAVVSNNLAMLIWIALGTISCWYLYPLAAWIYLAVALIMVVVVLRKIVCTNCYYYGKWCSTGWGKLAALLFKQGEMERFSKSTGVKIAPITYILMSLVPAVLLIISIVQESSVQKIVVLGCLLLITVYSAFINRKKSCRNCKMKLACPGSVG